MENNEAHFPRIAAMELVQSENVICQAAKFQVRSILPSTLRVDIADLIVQ